MAKRITFEGELQLGHLSMLAAASARELYVEELHRLAEKDERIVFVGADSGYSGAENKFREKYPDRMLPVGIAEQDQVGVAAGLALCGKIPYISGFGPFLALRTLDQVHTNVCYPAAQSCCLTAWSDRLPSRTRRIRFTLHSRLRFISTGGSLFWQPTNRHFRLCRASSSRKNRSILPMSSTCFSRFWNR